MGDEAKIIPLKRAPARPSGRALISSRRYEIASAGPNPEFAFIGSDPYETNVGTGLVVPTTPSASIANARYLFMLARASFQTGEVGARLVGIRQYAEIIARIPIGETGQTTVFRREIEQPLWHPPDGDISWHVMVIPQGYRDFRNPANTDGVIFQDSPSPALLFQTLAPAYSPPNAGKPWGTALGASLGNMHDLRYRWMTERSEVVLDIPIPAPCEVALFASVRQNDPATNPTAAGLTDGQITALSREDRFLVEFSSFAQYGVVAGTLVFDEDHPDKNVQLTRESPRGDV